MTDMPERILAWEDFQGRGLFITDHTPRGISECREYIRADLLAAAHLEIETLAEAALRDMQEIARLRGLLKARDGGGCDAFCASRLTPTKSLKHCNCHHGAVAAYFEEIGE